MAFFFMSSFIPEHKNPFPVHFTSAKHFKLLLIALMFSCALHEGTALWQTYIHYGAVYCDYVARAMIWWHSQAFLLTLHIAILKCGNYAVVLNKKMLKFMLLQVKMIAFSGWIIFPILLGFGTGGDLMDADDGSGVHLCLHHMKLWCVVVIWVCLFSLTVMVFVLFLMPVIQLMSNVDGRDYLVVRNFVGVIITLAGMCAVSVQNTLYGESSDVNIRVKLATTCSIDMLANTFGLAFVFIMGFHRKGHGDSHTHQNPTKEGATSVKDTKTDQSVA